MKINTYCIETLLAFSLMLCMEIANAARITLTTDESSSITSSDVCAPKISFDGEIEAKDLDTLKRIVERTCANAKKNPNAIIEYTLRLNSEGGDVAAALEIGRFIRNVNLPVKQVYFSVQIWPRNRCYSSCVFILAAGVRRLPLGDIGIHRPYFVALDTKYSAEEIRRIRLAQNKIIKDYLIEMDVAESLLDAMLAIPAERVKVLTPTELSHYRLTGDDANFDEKNIAQDARKWYLGSSQYRQRKALVEKQCGHFFDEKYKTNSQDFYRCEGIIMLEISGAEYDSRAKKVSTVCATPELDKDRQKQLACMYRVLAGK